MKKFIRAIFVILALLIVAGYGLYYFGTNLASDKVMEMVNDGLADSGQKEEIKKMIESDPELRAYVEEGKSMDADELPFETKEEATRVLVKKIGLTERQTIQEQAENGTESKEEIMNTVEQKLTKEELQALKVIAYKELYQ